MDKAFGTAAVLVLAVLVVNLAATWLTRRYFMRLVRWLLQAEPQGDRLRRRAR